jgi:Tfp pilus assembly protein PilZ
MENRQCERVQTDYTVQVTVPTLGEEVRDGSCLNLSEGGLFVQMEEPLPVGLMIDMEIHLLPIGKTLRTEGLVVWARPRMDHSPIPPGIGVSFRVLERDERSLIQSTIEEQKRLTGSSAETATRRAKNP